MSEYQEDPNRLDFQIRQANDLAHSGEIDAGIKLITEISENSDLDAANHYDIGVVYAVVAKVMFEKGIEQSDSGKSANEYQENAMQRLQLAGEGGMFDKKLYLDYAATDRDLDSLEGVPEFIEFCEEYKIERNE